MSKNDKLLEQDNSNSQKTFYQQIQSNKTLSVLIICVLCFGAFAYLNDNKLEMSINNLITRYANPILDSAIINAYPNYNTSSTNNLSKTNASAFSTPSGDFAINGGYGLVFYDAFDLLDNNTDNQTYDYTKNVINGTYESHGLYNNTFYNQSAGLFGGAGQINSLTQPSDSCPDKCTTYAVIDYGNISNLQFNYTDQHTISFWFYPINMSSSKQTRLVSYYGETPNDGTYSGWQVSYNNYTVGNEVPKDSVEYCYSTSSGSFSCTDTNASTVKLNQWNHVAFTYNGTNSANARRLWLNGVEYFIHRGPGVSANANYNATLDVDMGYGIVSYEFSKFRIGNFQYGAYTEASQFKIDELMIFNKTMTDNTLDNIYKNQSNRFPAFSYMNLTVNMSNYTRQANISLYQWMTNFSGNISLIINNGSEQWFNLTDGTVNNYNQTGIGDLNYANLSIRLYAGNSSSYNTFLTPVIKGNITFVTFDDSFAPIVNLSAPANATIINISTISLNASFVDNAGLVNGTLYVWNSTNNLINTTTQTLSGLTGFLNTTINLTYADNYTWNYLAVDNNNNRAFNNTNWTFQYVIPQATANYYPNSSLNLTITGVNGGRFGRFVSITDNHSTNALDGRDSISQASPSNGTTFFSVITGSNLALDSWNNTNAPRILNLTYNSNPNMGSGTLLNLTWLWNQSDWNVTLVDYGIDSTRTNNVSSDIDLKLQNEYSVILNSSRANNYFKLRFTVA